MIATLRVGLATLLSLTIPLPAAAQWTRVVEVPEASMVSVWVNGDTIAAGSDSTAYLSTDGGATWVTSATVAAGVTSVQAVRVHNGRVYAGTFGQGVFVSDDLGQTWTAFNQGLTGGLFNSQLFIADFLLQGDSLYAATSGAGPYLRNLKSGTWSHYGNVFEPNSASNMSGISFGGSRLLACAGGNGMVFFRDPGQSDWTRSFLNNTGPAAGLGAMTSVWTGEAWVVATNGGVFRSALGQSPWTFVDLGLGTLFITSLALRGSDVFASFGVSGGTTIAYSHDDGVTWNVLDDQPFVFTFGIASGGNQLYAARFDGLWRRSIANVAVPPVADPTRLRFEIAGPNPIRDEARFRFALPEAGPAEIEVFDLSGRRVSGRIEGAWPAGIHEERLSLRDLAAGVYLARLTAAGRSAVVRVVRMP